MVMEKSIILNSWLQLLMSRVSWMTTCFKQFSINLIQMAQELSLKKISLQPWIKLATTLPNKSSIKSWKSMILRKMESSVTLNSNSSSLISTIKASEYTKYISYINFQHYFIHFIIFLIYNIIFFLCFDHNFISN